MATVFETRLIGNIGKDAVVKHMEKGVIAINFTVAHNKNWKDKRSGKNKSKTTWVSCTIWKKDSSNLRIAEFLKQGNLVEILGVPFAKGFLQDDGTIRTEIRLNVSAVNILRSTKTDDQVEYVITNENENELSQDAENQFDTFSNETDF